MGRSPRRDDRAGLLGEAVRQDGTHAYFLIPELRAASAPLRELAGTEPRHREPRSSPPQTRQLAELGEPPANPNPCLDKGKDNGHSVVTAQLPGMAPRCEIKDTSRGTKLSAPCISRWGPGNWILLWLSGRCGSTAHGGSRQWRSGSAPWADSDEMTEHSQKRIARYVFLPQIPVSAPRAGDLPSAISRFVMYYGSPGSGIESKLPNRAGLNRVDEHRQPQETGLHTERGVPGLGPYESASVLALRLIKKSPLQL
ncbi:hypothetical protein SKAU_G00053600 [Synaphobranchus kaupii]|uniref:Uncharacterized protein n=1 Tax=Synaphobranchus kaupii TaxID=118154 RepID=A0A9Q1G4X1_SYNKA|nr:hypothetical protein SKAU_G00053600 [Synaphobranchus kaupii]